MNTLHADLSPVEAVVLSHGYFDHFGGLIEFLNRANKEISVVLHPDAFLERSLNIPTTNRRIYFPRLDEAAINNTGAVLQ